MGIFPNDFSGKINPNANDKIILADSEDNDNTNYCLLSSLFNAVFFGKTSDNINEGTINRFYTTSRENELVHNTGNQNIDGDLIITGSFNGDGSGITGINAEVPSASLNYELGEDITAGKACSLNTDDGKVYLGGTNFIGISEFDKTAGEIGKFNTQYSNKLNGLTPKAYYGYDKETGEIIPGNKFYAISSSELFLNNSFNNKNITFLIAGEDINKGDLLHFNTFDGKIYKTNSDNINFIGFSAFDSFKGSYVGIILYGEIEVNEKLIPGKKYFFQTNGTYSTNVTLNFIGYATGENLLLKETNISNLLGGALDIWSTGASSSIHRDRCGIGAYNNFLYTAGGYDGNDNLKTGEKYDILNNTWSTIADMPSVKSDLSNYAPIVNGKMYIIGGYSGSDETTNYEYDIDSNTWVSKAEMPTARNDLSIAEIGTDIYALGGEAGGDYLSVVEKYDTLTDEWSTVDSMSEARYKFTIIPYDNKIYYFGGYNGDHLTSSYEFDGTNHIALPNLPISRYGGTGGVIGGDLYIISGYEDGSNLTDRVTKYDILNKTYEDKTAIPTARRYLGGCSFNNKIYCFGGVEAGKTLEIYS